MNLDLVHTDMHLNWTVPFFLFACYFMYIYIDRLAGSTVLNPVKSPKLKVARFISTL